LRGLCEALPGLISSFLPKDDEYSVIWALRNFGGDPFVLLVSIVLSQNTSDSNAIRALRNFLEMG
jgi:endonuclease III